MDKKKQKQIQILKEVFANTAKTVTHSPIVFSNDTELVIISRPISDPEVFETENDYFEYTFQRHIKAAKQLFETIHGESCIAFWLELTKLIKEHCTESDEENKRVGIVVPPEGHFRRMFNETVKDK